MERQFNFYPELRAKCPFCETGTVESGRMDSGLPAATHTNPVCDFFAETEVVDLMRAVRIAEELAAGKKGVR